MARIKSSGAEVVSDYDALLDALAECYVEAALRTLLEAEQQTELAA